MARKLQWAAVTTIIVFALAGGLLLTIQPKTFDITLNGDIQAKYKDNVLKLYNGRYLELESEPRVEWYDSDVRAYRRTNKVTKDEFGKYSNLSYAIDDAGFYHIMQKVRYGQGVLNRYFIINDKGSIKEYYRFDGDNPQGRYRLRLRYCSLEDDKPKVYLDSSRSVIESNALIGEHGFLQLDWINDLEQTSRVERFKNGCLQILTKPQTGVLFYDPAIKTQKEVPQQKNINTYRVKDTQFRAYDIRITSTGELSSVDFVKKIGKNLRFTIPPLTLEQQQLYVGKLSQEKITEFNDYGIRIDSGSGHNYSYIDPNVGGLLDINPSITPVVKVGSGTTTINITNFFYGEGNANISIDTTVELSESDNDITPPQSNNLLYRFDFVNDLTTDTSGQGNDVSNTGTVTRTHERASFAGLGTGNGLNLGDKFDGFTEGTFAAWIKLDSEPGVHGGNDDFVIVAEYEGGGTSDGEFLWYINNDDNVYMLAGPDGSVSTAAPEVGEISFLSVTWENNNLTLWEDATSKATDTSFASNVTLPGAFDHTIGWDKDIAPRVLNGSIYSVLFWNVTLTQSELEEYYNQTRFDTQGDTQTYSGVFTGGTLTGTDNTDTWSTYTFGTTEPGGTSVEVRSRSGNISDTVCEDTTDLLFGYKFNTTDDLTDCTGKYNLTAGDMFTNESGLFEGDKAIGSNDSSTSINTTDTIPTNFDSFSIQAWVYPTQSTLSRLISNHDGVGTPDNGVIQFTDTSVNFISCNVREGGSTISATKAFTSNEWNFWSCDWNGSHLKAVVNGVSGTKKSLTSLTTLDRKWTIAEDGVDDDQNFIGIIDSIEFYANRSFTDAELLDKYASFDAYNAWSTSNPRSIDQSGRLLQYQARLNTTNNSQTPILTWFEATIDICGNVCNLFWKLSGDTEDQESRYYYIYFDINDTSYSAKASDASIETTPDTVLTYVIASWAETWSEVFQAWRR